MNISMANGDIQYSNGKQDVAGLGVVVMPVKGGRLAGPLGPAPDVLLLDFILGWLVLLDLHGTASSALGLDARYSNDPPVNSGIEESKNPSAVLLEHVSKVARHLLNDELGALCLWDEIHEPRENRQRSLSPCQEDQAIKADPT